MLPARRRARRRARGDSGRRRRDMLDKIRECSKSLKSRASPARHQTSPTRTTAGRASTTTIRTRRAISTRCVLRQVPLQLAGARVLEVGCGTGKNSAWLVDAGARAHRAGLLTRHARRRATSRARIARRASSSTTSRGRGRWTRASMDVVVGNLVLEHVRDLASGLPPRRRACCAPADSSSSASCIRIASCAADRRTSSIATPTRRSTSPRTGTR